VTDPAITVLDACADGALFGRWFRVPETWSAWFAFLKTLFGLPIGEADRAVSAACTGREAPAEGGYREAWLVVGRRGDNLRAGPGRSAASRSRGFYLVVDLEDAMWLRPDRVRIAIVSVCGSRKGFQLR